jgi:hypothetical protein
MSCYISVGQVIKGYFWLCQVRSGLVCLFQVIPDYVVLDHDRPGSVSSVKVRLGQIISV